MDFVPAGGDSLSQEAFMKPTLNVAPSGDTNDEANSVKTEVKFKVDMEVKEESVEVSTVPVKVEEDGSVKLEVKVEESATVTVESESSEKPGEGMEYGNKDLEVPAATVEVETESYVKEQDVMMPNRLMKTEPMGVLNRLMETEPMGVSKAEEAIKTDSDSSDDELENYGMPPVDMSFAREKLDTPQGVSSTFLQDVSCHK